ncbi:hypothetical protein A2U01_0085092, partial [Trifolium medium]|nr:hypothetical protein [Trifolium medium]
MDFNTMIGKCNISWFEEFYANALGYVTDDYTSTVRGKTISYASDVIDEMFGFRPADYFWASQQRASAHTDE